MRALRLCLPLVLLLAGCGRGLVLAPRVQSPQSLAAASHLTADESVVIQSAAQTAQGAIANANQVYQQLGLDTAAGRKITPEREPLIRAALLPVVQRCEHDTASILTLLKAHPTPKVTYVQRQLEKAPPSADDAVPPEAGSADLLYRIAQYRVKLGALVEYALRKDAGPTPEASSVPAEPQSSD